MPRRAVGREVPGRRAQHHPGRREAPADERRTRQRRDADREVESFLDEIDDPVGQRDVEHHLRMPRPEFAPQRREMQVAERERRVDAQQSARDDVARGDLRLGLVDEAEQFAAARVEDLAFLGERQPAGRPVQQPDAEPRLQLADVARHRRLRHRECIRRLHEAAGVHDGGEGLHLHELVHCADSRNSGFQIRRFIPDRATPRVRPKASASIVPGLSTRRILRTR